MMGEDGVERNYPMSKKSVYVSTATGEETIYIWCASKQKACPASGSVKGGVTTVRGVHNHALADGEREVSVAGRNGRIAYAYAFKVRHAKNLAKDGMEANPDREAVKQSAR